MLVFFSSCGMQTQDEYTATIFLSGTSLYYEIKNLDHVSKFVPKSYNNTKSNDTIIFEAYFKSPAIEYNQFGVPKMHNLLPDSSIVGQVKVSDTLRSKFHYFFRVFNKDSKVYFKEKKINAIAELDFIQYEKDCSRLIKAEWK